MPSLIGFNKVLLQKITAHVDLNAEFTTRFPAVPRKKMFFWPAPTLLFPAPLRSYFVHSAGPGANFGERALEALLIPEVTMLIAKRSEQCR